METAVEFVGFYGPDIICFVNIFPLAKYTYYLIAYLVFLVINNVLNGILKQYIKEPRPTGHELITGIFDKENYKGTYGMPSRHSQFIFFSAFYTWFVVKNNDLLWLELFIALLTIYQRWKFRRHSIQQLLAGALLGIVLAWVSFGLVKKFYQQN